MSRESKNSQELGKTGAPGHPHQEAIDAERQRGIVEAEEKDSRDRMDAYIDSQSSETSVEDFDIQNGGSEPETSKSYKPAHGGYPAEKSLRDDIAGSQDEEQETFNLDNLEGEDFLKKFWDGARAAKSFDELYGVIKSVDDFSQGDDILTPDEVIVAIEKVRKGEAKLALIEDPDLTKIVEALMLEEEKEEAPKKRVELSEEKGGEIEEAEEEKGGEIEEAEEEKGGEIKEAEGEKTKEGVEPPELPLDHQIKYAEIAFVSARDRYHRALLAHRDLRRKRENPDKDNPIDEAGWSRMIESADAEVAASKEEYLQAMQKVARLEARKNIEEYRDKCKGKVRFVDLSAAQIEVWNTDHNPGNLPMPEFVDDETLANLGLNPDEITALKEKDSYPNQEISAKATAFRERFVDSYKLKQGIGLEKGTNFENKTFEKFGNWWNKRHWVTKVGMGVLLGGAIATGAGAVAGAMGATGLLTGAIAGGSAGGVLGMIRGMSIFNKRDTLKAIDDMRNQTLDQSCRTWAKSDPVTYEEMEGINKALVNNERNAHSEKKKRELRRIWAIARSGAKGVAIGAAAGTAMSAVLGWLFGSGAAGAGGGIEGGIATPVETPEAPSADWVTLDTPVESLESMPVPEIAPVEPITVPDSPPTPEPIPDITPPTPPTPEPIPDIAPGGVESAPAFDLNGVTEQQAEWFKELHKTLPNPTHLANGTGTLDGAKMAIGQILERAGIMGTSNGINVPSPELNTFFNLQAGGNLNAQGWNSVLNTLLSNPDKVTGIDAVKGLFTQ